MLRSIRELIADIRRTESEKRDSEIRALQAQINPHFLYNTLNTIQFLASLQGAENIKAVSLALSSMLHVNLNREKLIPVNEEIQYLKNYLEIQEYRFTGKFTSYFSSDTTSQSALIPKLLLQPIVENALLHGIAPQDRAGILQIKFFVWTARCISVLKITGRESPHSCWKHFRISLKGTMAATSALQTSGHGFTFFLATRERFGLKANPTCIP